MGTQIFWTFGHLTSCLHAAWALAEGRTLVDDRLAHALAEPAARWQHVLQEAGLGVPFWRHLLALSAGQADPQELLEAALQHDPDRARPPDLDERLAEPLGRLQQALHRVLPGLDQELALRVGPLRQQWEARGPGLLHTATGLTAPDLLPPRADVLPVYPMLGGGGGVHWPHRSVRIEAVLANPVTELPEVLRLGWLLAQLSDVRSEAARPWAPQRQRQDLLGLALLCVTLAAAEQVELSRCDRPGIQLALRAWGLAPGESPELTETLFQWWETVRHTQLPWPAALQQLDRRLG